MNIVVVQRIFFALLIDAITGPVWWYTKGALYIISWWKETVERGWDTIGAGLWAKNIFVPMYAQHDWQGRIISFLVRFVQVVVRFIVFIFYFFAVCLITVLWFAAPIIVVYYFVLNLF